MVEFDVHMRSGDLYDYLLRHTYASFMGIFGSVTGALMILGGFYAKAPLLAAAGLVVLLYLPFTLLVKSAQQLAANPAFREALHYVLDDEGIHVSQGEAGEMQKWDDIVKAVSTGRSLIVYTSRVNACIFPRRELGDKTALAIQVISTHLPPGKVKIKQ